MEAAAVRDHLLKHAKSKRNGQFSPLADRAKRQLNPICGDQVEFRARVENGCIRDIGFATQACAICAASASLLTEFAEGQKIADLLKMKNDFTVSLVEAVTEPWPDALSAFAGFEHLRVNPRRRGCAILPWLALTALTSDSSGNLFGE